MATKKPTNKDRDQQILFLTKQTQNFGQVFGAYIDFMGNSVDFQKHLIDLREKQKEGDAKDDTKVPDRTSDKSDSEKV